MLARLPAGPWLYPDDQISDLPSRMLAAEATREKLFMQLHQELPYNLTVETELFEVQKNGDLKINQVIYVTRDSHKAMVLGKSRSARIKQVGSQSRQDHRRTVRPEGALVLVREGSGELAQRSGAVPRNGAGAGVTQFVAYQCPELSLNSMAQIEERAC